MADFSVAIVVRAIDKASRELAGISASVQKNMGGIGQAVSGVSAEVKNLSATTGTFKSKLARFGYAIEENAGKLQMLANAVGSVGRAMAAAGATILGILGTMTYKASAWAKATLEAAEAMGMTTEAYTALAYAAEKSGATSAQFEQAIRSLSQRAWEASRGGAAATQVFTALGVNVLDAAGKLKPMDVLLAEVADKFAAMPESTEKTALAVKLFGMYGSELIPFLNEGSKGLAALRAEAEKLGIVMDEQTLRQMSKLKEELFPLKKALLGLALIVAQAVGPALVKLVQWLTGVISKVSAWMREHPTLARSLTMFAVGIGILLAALGPLLMVLSSLANIFLALVVGAGALGISFGAVGAVIASVIGAIGGFIAAAAPIVALIASIIAAVWAICWAVKGLIEYWDDLKWAYMKVWDGMKEKIISVWNWMKALPAKFYEWGRSLILRFAEGIEAAAMAPINAVKKLAQKIGDFLHLSSGARLGPLRDLPDWGKRFSETFAAGMQTGAKYLSAAGADLAGTSLAGISSDVVSRRAGGKITIEITLPHEAMVPHFEEEFRKIASELVVMGV